MSARRCRSSQRNWRAHRMRFSRRRRVSAASLASASACNEAVKVSDVGALERQSAASRRPTRRRARCRARRRVTRADPRVPIVGVGDAAKHPWTATRESSYSRAVEIAEPVSRAGRPGGPGVSVTYPVPAMGLRFPAPAARVFPVRPPPVRLHDVPDTAPVDASLNAEAPCGAVPGPAQALAAKMPGGSCCSFPGPAVRAPPCGVRGGSRRSLIAAPTEPRGGACIAAPWAWAAAASAAEM